MAISPYWSPFSSGAATSGASSLLPWVGPALMGISFLSRMFQGKEEPEEPGMSGQYRPSRFLPESQPSPYDPRVRQSRSDSPLMSYLQRFMR